MTMQMLPPFSAENGREIDILARTLWGEARGESVRGKEAVAAVVLNRVARAQRRGGYWWGRTVSEVCLKAWQFSCWNANDPNRPKLEAVGEENAQFRTCLRIATRAVHGGLEDPTRGATHYHAKSVSPAWARGKAPCAEIGNHFFYNDVE
ncbi:cell wall hydrolase [Telmatospirillum sp. J64-1]|uniref:cell wall hydrolase n=1 Tax=Telmatospirillum sp. J64-1 TaxID=2502183 RepID=UPI002106DCF0|nr:cell wall hydrolase [Telmatospirillum sp. J64-1]